MGDAEGTGIAVTAEIGGMGGMAGGKGTYLNRSMDRWIMSFTAEMAATFAW